MNANAPTLTERVRIPLHELQADVDYLIGRVVADGSCAPTIAASIKGKLAAIETALTVPNGMSPGDLFNGLVRSLNYDGPDTASLTLGEIAQAVHGATLPNGERQ